MPASNLLWPETMILLPDEEPITVETRWRPRRPILPWRRPRGPESPSGPDGPQTPRNPHQLAPAQPWKPEWGLPQAFNVLDSLNAMRARHRLYGFRASYSLQLQAEYESAVRAKTRRTGHLPNGCFPGRAEGVGWNGGSGPDNQGWDFHTCFYMSRGYRFAGAAVATNGGQNYYTLCLW